MSQLLNTARILFNLPGLLAVKHGVRSLQTLLNFSDAQRLKQLAESLAVAPLLERQPRFRYKYLSRYLSASFSRTTRLKTILNHYHFLAEKTRPAFFTQLPQQLTIWRETCGDNSFSISLSYPRQVGFEGELSLNFYLNSTPLQVVSFVIVPGQVVGATGAQALLIGQVQGTPSNAAALKQATKALHDITPAALLVNAAYGVAEALGIGHAAGVSTAEQLSHGAGSSFDYDGFWQQFGGAPTVHNLFLLDIPAAEKPISSIKPNHRARTLRKRQYKQQLRAAIAAHFQSAFLK